MNSKKLDSILKNIPPATIADEKKLDAMQHVFSATPNKTIQEKTERIVAEIPQVLKEEIKNYIDKNKGITERIIILKALKLFGFHINDDWLVDKRSTR
ncbi:hypothetical protein A3305_07730 (plasmid) [Rickettsia amblyommatis]|uniref:Uncharacterized protein n=1 Tax=Rickettsia amblyommatis (strain GAT-30V) TaxID=1105111 RepID=H8K6D9_RICAG|nr:hypothetical protein [Rickettsia amblyommatis]AFC70450.1 hypothetical protein MCE_08665 [Rickettsia amblyommatis str. GAT-30V]ALA62311.1 hypothetical protein AL573_07535 [Rickettsia amblyommatis]ARD88240.1 hypothetical protein A3305_07730 [Rickettsia amblyommatis]KJV99911.1 hypothetical protein RAMDARK_1771 [Rickettsia amblyommatis str. Darkwater]